MPTHKMITIDGVRVRAEDEARYRARAGKPARVLSARQADPPRTGQEPDDDTGVTGRRLGDAPELTARLKAEAAYSADSVPENQLLGTPEQNLFDPGEHTVDQVLAYLEGADETETARVLAAEAAGKGRKTITEKR